MAEKQENKSIQSTKFEVAELRKHCRQLFQVNPEVFDGAFFGVIGKFTKSEAKKKIDTFLKKKVPKAKKEVK